MNDYLKKPGKYTYINCMPTKIVYVSFLVMQCDVFASLIVMRWNAQSVKKYAEMISRIISVKM